MKILFKHLKAHHFLSLGDIELDLQNKGYVIVNGVNNNPKDNASSNGSGKSSIWSAICFALTGETIQGLTKNLPNIYYNDGCWVELDFIVDNNEYKLIRYKDDKSFGSDLKIYINGEDKSGKGIRESQNLLNQYLPDLTSELIGSIIILGQGMPHKFSNNTPSGRKEVLEKLSKSDFMILDIKNRLNAREAILKNDLRKYEDISIELNTQLKLYLGNVEKNTIKLNEFEKNNITDEEYNNKLIEIDNQLNIINSLIEDNKKELELVESQLLTLNDKLSNLTTLKNNELTEALELFNNDSNEYNRSILDLDVQIRNLKNEIIKLDNIKDICPTCGQKLPNVIKQDTSSLKQQLEELINLKNEKSLLLDAIKGAYEDNRVAINSKYNDQSINLNNEIRKTRENKSNIELNVRNNERNISQFETNKNTLINNRDMYIKYRDQLLKDIEELNNNINDLNTKLEKNNTTINDLKLHLDVLNQINTLVKRDFRGFLLTNVIEFINKKAKEYSLEVFGTNELDFELNGNNIDISYCNKMYENLSGGEKQKVDIILQFAIRDMMCQYLGYSSNILILDELFDQMDMLGCTNILNLISKKLLDIDSIFIISHRSYELEIPYDNELVIEKDENGVSKLR